MDDLDRSLKTNEVLLREHDKWLLFASPMAVITAYNLEEVLPSLREVERLVAKHGWHAAGFLSYESAPAFDSAFQTNLAEGFPYLWFGLYKDPSSITLPQSAPFQNALAWQPTIEQETYNAAIAKIKDYISAGRTYQVNYTLRLQADFAGNAWDFFLHLAQQQNEQAAFVDIGRYVICSASPELFFRLDGEKITCRPMKGTTRRGRTTMEDDERATWLRHSEKNRAENVMIVDMVRNDLGRIAKTGSVCVPHLFETERYPTLWQMTSTVTARTNKSLTEIMTALFPCASITGAPKVSTMGIIAELENTPRKMYTGSIGYIAPGPQAKFNVAIRTVLLDRESDTAEYGVGGGIVWDSTHSDEYAEALLKASLLTEQRSDFSLLETMLWTPEEGFFLRDRHIARLLDSADYFDIPVKKENVEAYFEYISSGFHAARRVRVLLSRTGELSFEANAFYPEEQARTLKACLAKRPVDSANVYLFHKTTERSIYEAAKQGCETFDDVLLHNELGELTEFTIGNLVVELDDQLFTPPISCGVLAGTLRAHLLDTGQVQERVIPLADLIDCTAVFRVNSIRKWQSVQMHAAQVSHHGG